ncbi:MAG: NTP transferase domain-containing protein [Candidatus Methylomirabilia bacterium]
MTVDRALMLAAGAGLRLSPVSDGLPKVLLQVGGKTLLQRHLEHLTALGIPELVIVIGYEEAEIREEVARQKGMLPVHFLYNPRYREAAILSLWSARHALRGSVLFMDGDLLYPRRLLASVAHAQASTCFLMDPRPLQRDGEEIKLLTCNDRVLYIGRSWPVDQGQVGEWVGVARFGDGRSERLRAVLEEFVQAGRTRDDYEDTMNEVLQGAEAGVVDVGGLPWVEIDFPEDFELAVQLLPAIEALDREWERTLTVPTAAKSKPARKAGSRQPGNRDEPPG